MIQGVVLFVLNVLVGVSSFIYDSAADIKVVLIIN